MRPVTLELGGKSAAIVLDDADLDATIRAFKYVSFVNNGQTCHLNSPIPAPRSRYQEVVDAVAALAEGLTVGNPIDKATDIGPLVSSRQRERVLDYIQIGKSEGAKLVAGGSVPADQPCGWFVAPTVFADVDNPARISQEEIFGPVLTVTPYENDRDAVERATDTARSVRTGTIGVNDYQMDIIAPFGGVKAGGIGRELGPEGLAAYQTLKSIYRVGPSD
jgi:aldehyde dehydrogenase (NAD+)